MKFGKLFNIDAVDFQLPQDADGTVKILEQLPLAKTPTLYIGCTGWGMKEWIGTVYPKGAKAKDFLAHYTKQFNTIELNTTHYRIPSLVTIDSWKKTATPDFRFCPKIPQMISHSRDLGLSEGHIIAFCEAIQRLERHLGCCFMQLAPHFEANKLSLLADFLDFFPKHIPLSVEVRHESWFSFTKNTEALASLLEQHNTAFVITDVAGRRDVLHQRLSNGTALIRFVGNDLHPSDYDRIDEWVQRLKQWFDKGIQAVYFFTHEPDNIKAPVLAKYLADKIRLAIPNIQTRGPSLDKNLDGQMSLF